MLTSRIYTVCLNWSLLVTSNNFLKMVLHIILLPAGCCILLGILIPGLILRMELWVITSGRTVFPQHLYTVSQSSNDFQVWEHKYEVTIYRSTTTKALSRGTRKHIQCGFWLDIVTYMIDFPLCHLIFLPLEHCTKKLQVEQGQREMTSSSLALSTPMLAHTSQAQKLESIFKVSP